MTIMNGNIDEELNSVFFRMLNKYAMFYNKKIEYKGVVLTPSEAQILKLISGKEDYFMNDIARELGISKPAVTKAIKKLEQRDLLTLTVDDGNRKYKIIELTKMGVEATNVYDEFIYNHIYGDMNMIFTSMTKEDQDKFKEIIRLVESFFEQRLQTDNLS